MDTIYCKLYTKSEKNYNSLLEFLQSSKFCNSCEFNIGIIQSDCFEMELIKNKDIVGDESDRLFWPDFLFWPYFIEIGRTCDSFDDFIKSLNEFIQFLRDNNIQVVASCDFEELLGQKPWFYNETGFV